MAAKRVMVFLDYQNVYMRAREAFGLEAAAHMHGQIDPYKLGLGLKALKAGERTLEGIRVFRGMPRAEKDQKGNDAFKRQVGVWQQKPVVSVTHRSLNYRDPYHPQEKGIDVALAIDFVTGAIDDKYDVGILFSEDTDLLPAVEAVLDRKGPTAIEVATWVPSVDGRGPKPLRIPDRYFHIHYLDQSKFAAVQDLTDYTQRRRRR